MATGNQEPPVKQTKIFCVELECTEPDTRHYQHIWCHKKNGGALAYKPPSLGENDVINIPNLFAASAKKFANKNCMGTRTVQKITWEGKRQFWTKGPYEWKTYSQVHNEMRMGAKGFLELPGIKDLREAQQCKAAILAETSAEWHISAHVAFNSGVPITTVYSTLGHEAMVYALNETEAAVLFIDWDLYKPLIEPVLSKCTALKHIVLIGKCFVPLEVSGGELRPFPSAEDAAALPPVNAATTTTLEALIAKGEKSSIDLEGFAPKTEDLAFIMYTSGSTGQPKGVLLTHANFGALIGAVDAQGTLKESPRDRFIAFLPLAHIMELFVETTNFTYGAQVAYAHARTATPNSPYIHPDNGNNCDLVECRPTLLLAVPAILDRIKIGLTAKLDKFPGFKGQLARGAVNKALGESANQTFMANALLGLGTKGIFIKKIKAQLGLESLRFIATGGAPLSPETHHFVSHILAPLSSGYGATETMGCMSVQECVSSGGRPLDEDPKGVGAIFPSCEIKLRSEPDMGYLVTDTPPRGEILVAGNTVSQGGYFKQEELTKKDFPRHADGKVWFHTGDIGIMTEKGTLQIIDRKKDLIKLSGGEYVSLGKVENAVNLVKGVGLSVIFAQSSKDHCVAIVSAPEAGWNSVGGMPTEDVLLADIEKSLREQQFARFEIPTKVKIDDFLWTPEDGLVTPSRKLSRNPLRKHYNKPGGLLESMGYKFPE